MRGASRGCDVEMHGQKALGGLKSHGKMMLIDGSARGRRQPGADGAQPGLPARSRAGRRRTGGGRRNRSACFVPSARRQRAAQRRRPPQEALSADCSAARVDARRSGDRIRPPPATTRLHDDDSCDRRSAARAAPRPARAGCRRIADGDPREGACDSSGASIRRCAPAEISGSISASKIQEDARDPGDDPPDFPTWELHRAARRRRRRSVPANSVQRRARVLREPERTIRRRKSTKSQWKDVYVEANLHRLPFRCAAASSRVPFGLDQTSGEVESRFRVSIARRRLPVAGRDIGGDGRTGGSSSAD